MLVKLSIELVQKSFEFTLASLSLRNRPVDRSLDERPPLEVKLCGARNTARRWRANVIVLAVRAKAAMGRLHSMSEPHPAYHTSVEA